MSLHGRYNRWATKIFAAKKNFRSGIKKVGHFTVASPAMANAAVTVIKLCIAIFTTPAILGNLGQDGLGIWMVSLSYMSIAGFANAGLASSVIMGLAHIMPEDARGKDQVNKEATTAMCLGGILCILTIIISMPFVSAVNWQAIFSQKFFGEEDLVLLMDVVFIALGLGFLSNIPKFVLIGCMKAQSAYMLDLIATIVGSLSLLFAIYFKTPIYGMAFWFLMPQMITLLALGLLLLFREQISFYKWNDFSLGVFVRLLNDGIKLAISQAAFSISSHSDLTFIGIIAGPASAATYGVAQRIFGIPLMFAAIINETLWPTLGRAYAEGRFDWVRKTFIRTLLITTSSMIFTSIVIGFSNRGIIKLWLNQNVLLDHKLLVGFGLSIVVSVAVHACDALLRATKNTNLIASAMTKMMFLNLVLTIVLIHLVGAAGAVWGTVISNIVCLLVPYYYTISRQFPGYAQTSRHVI